MGSLISWLIAAFDIRDVFVFGGAACIFYGLHLYSDVLAWTVIGCMFIALGMSMAKGNS
jgi:hypothetical protein